MTQMIDIVITKIGLVEKNYNVIASEPLLIELRELNKSFLDVLAEPNRSVHELVRALKFERTLAIIISNHFDNTMILRAATETLIWIFARDYDWIERIGDSNIILLYERLLTVKDIELMENVKSIGFMGPRQSRFG